MQTRFPLDDTVDIGVAADEPVPMSLRIRVPSWTPGTVTIDIDGRTAACGRAGTYVELSRTWKGGEVVSLRLPMALRLSRYVGTDPEGSAEHHALETGPVLMALVGAAGLPIPSDGLERALEPRAGRPLHFAVRGHAGCRHLPYWEVQDGEFTCYPRLDPRAAREGDARPKGDS